MRSNVSLRVYIFVHTVTITTLTWYSRAKAACLPSLQKLVISFAAIEKDGKTRRRATVSSAEAIFNLISDGNVFEAELSDDEDEFADTVGVQNLYIAEILT